MSEGEAGTAPLATTNDSPTSSRDPSVRIRDIIAGRDAIVGPTPQQVEKYIEAAARAVNASMGGSNNADPSAARDLKLLELAICEKTDAAFSKAIRESKYAPKTKEHIAAIAANVERKECLRFAVFHKSLEIGIDYFVIPLVKEIIQIETAIRIRYRLPFTEARLAKLRKRLRAIVIDDWSILVSKAYLDAEAHVARHSGGRVFEYIQKELENIRIKYERIVP